jgi:hypothetical protein
LHNPDNSRNLSTAVPIGGSFSFDDWHNDGHSADVCADIEVFLQPRQRYGRPTRLPRVSYSAP